MKPSLRALLTKSGLPAFAAASLFGALALQGPAQREPVVLVPFITSGVRALAPIEAQVLVYNAGGTEDVVRVVGLTASVAGDVLVDVDVDAELPGDPEYGVVNALIERLPDDVTELHRERRYFAGAGDAEFTGVEVLERLREVSQRVSGLRAKYAAGIPTPFVQPVFTLPLDQIFLPTDPKGTTATLNVEVQYDARGERRVATLDRTLTWLAPRVGLSNTLNAEQGTPTVHAGDLHVHSCHGEATGACAPSGNCPAESLQTSGSFSYAQLKSQYVALGLDWFTATDHSYCINNDAEYQTIVSETAALTDGAFIVYPDIELSSDEEGPQQGSDTGDTVCLGTTSANHMGAHGITARIAGGDDAFLGFCDGLFGGNALDGFTPNAALVRAQGGYPIINHPAAGSFAWNSFAATQGIEANQMHGVEIWNGPFQSGQGGHVANWVNWLLGGRLLYAYSGSDTHDAAFDFGANHVILAAGTPFTPDAVKAAVVAGSTYVSNGPSLVLEVDLGGVTIPMGSLHPVPSAPPSAAVTVRAHYNFGTDTGTVTLYRGRVGDASEAMLCQSGSLTGQGFFECGDTLAGVQSWYRAYAQNAAVTETAYSNPVFFVPGTGDLFGFCSAKENSGGCLPAIAWSGTPSATAGSGFDVSVTDVIGGQNGLMIYGAQSDFAPFQGGTLCIAPPIIRTPVQPTGGGGGTCSGAMTFDFNAWIASGIDGSLVAGATRFAQYWYRDPGTAFPSGLSDAIQFTIQP